MASTEQSRRRRGHPTLNTASPSTLAVLALCLAALAAPHGTRAARISSIFSFGDDMLDVGNTNYLPKSTFKANFAPYGFAMNKSGNGRFADGQIFSDYLAKNLGLAVARPSLQPKNKNTRNGINFAVAAAGALNATNAAGTISLLRQVEQFKRYRAAKEKFETGRSALYVISAGVNDLIDFIRIKKPQSADAAMSVINPVTDNIVKAIKALNASSGAYKFVIFSVPPLGCMPLFLAPSSPPAAAYPKACLSSYNSISSRFESVLRQKVSAARRDIKGSSIAVVRLFAMLTQKSIGTNPYREPLKPCCFARTTAGALVPCGKSVQGVTARRCVDGSKNHFWWDARRPSSRGHQVIAGEAWRGGSGSIEPINIIAIKNVK